MLLSYLRAPFCTDDTLNMIQPEVWQQASNTPLWDVAVDRASK